jgi:hypothetical protein
LNNHAIEIDRALEEVKDEYDIIIKSCLNARVGIIQPQVLSPNHISQILKSSQDSFPRDLQAPVQLSDAYTYLLLYIITIEIYIVGNSLVYIVKVPLVTHYTYDVYRVLPFPIKVNNTRSKYTFIQPEREYILIDSTKQSYVKFRTDDISRCRKMDAENIICKQDVPLLVSHSTDDC